MTTTFKPGDHVRLSPDLWTAHGSIVGARPDRVWTVVACSCRRCTEGHYVAVDEAIGGVDGLWKHIATEMLTHPHWIETTRDHRFAALRDAIRGDGNRPRPRALGQPR